jgi:hypothetical protein
MVAGITAVLSRKPKRTVPPDMSITRRIPMSGGGIEGAENVGVCSFVNLEEGEIRR